MSSREEPDSVEWMRQRWLEQDEPKPEHFAAMAALLRTTILVTEEMDRVLKECQLSSSRHLRLAASTPYRDHRCSSMLTAASRISTLRTLPLAVIGKSSTSRT